MIVEILVLALGSRYNESHFISYFRDVSSPLLYIVRGKKFVLMDHLLYCSPGSGRGYPNNYAIFTI